MSSRSCIERSAATSLAASVIGVSSRFAAHSSRVKVRYGVKSCSALTSMSPCFSLALARCFFFEARHAASLGERRLDIGERNTARFQQDEQVIDQIGAFGHQGGVVT